MIAYVRPSIEKMDAHSCVIRIPLFRRTRNHLRSMYFGSLCIGADCAGGLLAWKRIEESGQPVALVFKDFKSQFLKRPESDVYFYCTEGAAIDAAVDQAIRTGERQELLVSIDAKTRKGDFEEVVAQFELTLSLKLKNRK